MEKFSDGEEIKKPDINHLPQPDEIEMAKLEYEAVFKSIIQPKTSQMGDFLEKVFPPEQAPSPKQGAVTIQGYSELSEDPVSLWIVKEIERLENDMWDSFLKTLHSEYKVERKFFQRIGKDMSFDLQGYLREKGLNLAADEKQRNEWETRMEDVFGVVSLSFMDRWRELSKKVAAYFSIEPSLSRQFDDRYLIIGKIGKGGSGKVYLAWHLLLRKKVAVKIIAFKKPVDPVFFDKEITNLASLDHANIIKVYQAGFSSRQGFLAMQYMEGGTLLDVIDPDNHIPLFSKDGRKGAMEIMIELTDALVHLHAKKPPLRHNDIKPANILFDGENIKLADFGISNSGWEGHVESDELEIDVSDDAESIDTEKYITGTPNYIAPEKLLDTPAYHHKSDIYSLGVTFFQLLTGFLPFDDADSKKLFQKVLNKDPNFIREYRYDIPPELELQIMFMLKKTPDERPDAETLLQELKTMKSAWESDPAFNQQMEIQEGPGTHQMRLLMEKRKRRLLERSQRDTEQATHADE